MVCREPVVELDKAEKYYSRNCKRWIKRSAPSLMDAKLRPVLSEAHVQRIKIVFSYRQRNKLTAVDIGR